MSQIRPEPRKVLPVKWSDANRLSLRDYIHKNPEFLAYLAYSAPFIETHSVEASALSGARHAGYEDLFETLSRMIEDEPPEAKSPFIQNEPITDSEL